MLQLFLIVIGLSCIGLALFVYENEEKQIQSVLENTWLRIDDLSKKSISKHLAFLVGVIDFSDRVLDKTYGKNLLTLRALAASATLSCLLLYYLGLVGFGFSLIHSLVVDTPESLLELAKQIVMADIAGEEFYLKGYHVLILFFLGFICFSIQLYALTLGTISALRAIIYCVAFYSLFMSPNILHEVIVSHSEVHDLLPFSFSWIESASAHFLILWTVFGVVLVTSLWFGSLLAISMAADVLIVWLTRKVMINFRSTHNSVILLLLILMLTCVGMALTLTPFSLVYRSGYLTEEYFNTDEEFYYASLTAIAVMNVSALILSVLTALLSILLGLHRLFWPVLLRPLYAIQRSGILNWKKTLLGFGTVLIGLGSKEVKNILGPYIDFIL